MADLLLTDKLLYSEATVAPSYPGPAVKVCCQLRSDLREVSPENFVRRIGVDGKTYWDLHYDLVLYTEAANLKFSLEIDGVAMGTVEANYT